MEPVSVPLYQTWAAVSDYSCATHVITGTVRGLVPRISFSVWWESRNEALHEHHDNLCQDGTLGTKAGVSLALSENRLTVPYTSIGFCPTHQPVVTTISH